jgi:MbtH protein
MNVRRELTVFDDDRDYAVVRNHEHQYSLWPTTLPVPAGWVVAGRTGTKEECLAEIAEVWTDLRPLSARNAVRREETVEA